MRSPTEYKRMFTPEEYENRCLLDLNYKIACANKLRIMIEMEAQNDTEGKPRSFSEEEIIELLEKGGFNSIKQCLEIGRKFNFTDLEV